MGWFNARDIDPASGSTSFPVGRHLGVIKSGARLPVKDKPNEGMLVLTIEIIDGQYKGISGPYRLNIWNSNPQAAEIAAKQLSALCCVTGRFDLESPNASELFGIPFYFLVQPQEDARYTQIVGVLDAYGNQPVKGQGPIPPAGGGAAPQQQQQQPPAAQWQPAQQQQPPNQAWPPAQPQPQQGAPSWQAPGQSGAPAPGFTPPGPGGGAAPSWQQQPAGPTKPSWAG